MTNAADYYGLGQPSAADYFESKITPPSFNEPTTGTTSAGLAAGRTETNIGVAPYNPPSPQPDFYTQLANAYGPYLQAQGTTAQPNVSYRQQIQPPVGYPEEAPYTPIQRDQLAHYIEPAGPQPPNYQPTGRGGYFIPPEPTGLTESIFGPALTQIGPLQTVQRAAGDIGGAIAPYLPTLLSRGAIRPVPALEPVGRFGGEAAVPTTPLEIALELTPLGYAGDVRRALMAPDFQDVIRRGGQFVDDLAPAARRLAAEESGFLRIPGGPEDVARAAPPPRVETPAPPEIPTPREPVFPRPSTLSSVSDIAADARRSAEQFSHSVPGRVGTLPIVRTAVNGMNPSALIDTPPQVLIDELGQEGATKLQADLLGHARRIDHANQMTATIEDGVRQQARAAGLDIQDGVVVSIPERPVVGDLFENPGKYTLTPEQKRFVDEVQALLDDVNDLEKSRGIAKNELWSEEGRYFPRLVREVRGVENWRAGVRRMTGAKQSFQRERFYTTMAEGIENGVRYEDDIGAIVGTRIRAGLKAVADKEIAELVRPLGHTLTKETPSVVGEMGTMVPAIGGRVFPQETAKRLIEALGTRYPGDIERVASAINNKVRPLQAIGDLSYTTLQLASTAFSNPAAFTKAMRLSLESILSGGQGYGRYIVDNSRQVERFTNAGLIFRPAETSITSAAQGKVMSQIFAKTGLGRLGKAFDVALNVAALENAKAMAGISDELGPSRMRRLLRGALGDFSGKTSDEVAASISNKMTGRISTRSLGVSAAQASIEGNVAFASNYYRAAFGLLADAVQGGMRGAEARRALASLATGAVVTHVALAEALGQEWKLDPTKSDFLTIKVGGQRVGIGGPFYGILRTIAEAAENPDDLDNILSMENPVTRWARGRLSPLVSVATDLVAQQTYPGYFEGAKDLSSIEEIAAYLAQRGLPFAAQTGIREGVAEGVPTFFGLRAFPTRPVLGDERDKVSQEMFGKPYRELFPDEQKRVNEAEPIKDITSQYKPGALSEVYAAKEADFERARTEGFGETIGAMEIDRQLADGTITGQDARAMYDALREEYYRRDAQRRESPGVQAELERIAEKRANRENLTEAEQATEEYYRILDAANAGREFDFDLWEREMERFRQRFGDVSDLISAWEPFSPGEQELRDARRVIGDSGWFDAYDEGFNLVRAGQPTLQRYASIDEFRDAVRATIRASGVRDEDEVADKLFQLENNLGITQAVNVAQARVLMQNSDIVPLLLKWYDLDPGELRVLQQLVPAGAQ